MKKRVRELILLLFTSLILLNSGCIDDDQFDNSAVGNFEALWKIMDERYCFFSYKEVDWNKIYDIYRPQIYDGMNNYALFNVMSSMLYELKDGHVNLVTPFDQARYWKWFEDYPVNYYADIVNKYYLEEPDYKIAGGIRYRILSNTNIGYMYYGNFSTSVSDSNLDEILFYFSSCSGIIIDVRSNGGGLLSNVDKIVSRFIKNDIVSGYIRHKLSPAHDDFSDLYPIEIKSAPQERVKFLDKPVAVLANRKSYSATNDFVSTMKQLYNVAIIGDKSGGGSGLPFSSQLPNGWVIRFSASPVVNSKMEEIEFGVDPTIKIGLSPLTSQTNTDDIILKAINWINSSSGF